MLSSVDSPPPQLRVLTAQYNVHRRQPIQVSALIDHACCNLKKESFIFSSPSLPDHSHAMSGGECADSSFSSTLDTPGTAETTNTLTKQSVSSSNAADQSSAGGSSSSLIPKPGGGPGKPNSDGYALEAELGPYFNATEYRKFKVRATLCSPNLCLI